ncbi:MAG: zinc ribbon domain-containing protein [bacterium]
MPLYEYKCSKCDHVFEKLESFGAEPVNVCPKCGAKAKRVLSLGSFILKGGGWYATEHPSRSHQKSKVEEKTSCGSSSGSS